MSKIKLADILKQQSDNNKDYSQFDKTFASWLKKEKGIKELQQIVVNAKDVPQARKQLIEKIKNVIKSNNLSVSDKYISKVNYHLGMQKTKDDLLKYLYNMYLKGTGFGTQ